MLKLYIPKKSVSMIMEAATCKGCGIFLFLLFWEGKPFSILIGLKAVGGTFRLPAVCIGSSLKE
jgi:hypothetical protein